MAANTALRTMPDAPNLPSEESSSAISEPVSGADDPGAAARKRPKPGERRVQILQALASMLEQPDGERITTAALAQRLGVSEAALYRHFASKAQMFEGLIEFIEQSVFSLINQIIEREQRPGAESAELGARQAAKVVDMVIQFAEKNPGLARVLVGDALVFEHERLQQRINQFFDKIEATLKQCLRDGRADAPLRASVVVAFLAGRLQRFVRSGFKRLPSERLDLSLALVLG